jgi:putative CRISPR-associated protein (TIGR02619 family)
MTKVVISSIGTSLLTQQINRDNMDEKDWYKLLRDTANLTRQNTPKNVINIVNILEERAIDKLTSSNIKNIRRASAELNGIYGLYQEDLTQAKTDFHWLICTDTLQGETTGKIVKIFLQKQSINVECYKPQYLSTADTESFTQGIDDLLTKLEEMTQGYDHVCFNLVGGFKSLQGYLNTIGMFYADEIIYIFEGENSDLITIPRLPIKVDSSIIEPYKVQFVIMSLGYQLPLNQLTNIPESLLTIVEGEATLSNWGKLTWNKCKKEFLNANLLTFPYLHYEKSFLTDYQNQKNPQERIKLQETLAKVSYLLSKNQGDRSLLRDDPGLLYETYRNTNIDHFRVNLALRISCQLLPNNDLSLHYYGTHNHVERSEGI